MITRNTRLEDIILNALNLCGGSIEAEARLNKIIYLADWLHAQSTGRTFTGLNWKRDRHGPFLHVIGETAEALPPVDVKKTYFKILFPRTDYHLKAGEDIPMLDQQAEEALVRAIEAIRPLGHDSMKELVYETPPMKAQTQINGALDIEAEARKERLAKVKAFAHDGLPKLKPLLDKLAE